MLDVVAKSAIPFDTKQLDRLMDQAGIDVLIANSKHNIHYLLGGHRSIFFDYMDAMGISRYLPLLVYPKGAPEKAAFFGHRLEAHQKEVTPFWTPEGNTNSAGSVDAMQKAVDYVRKSGVKAKRVGVEMAFLPADAAGTLRGGLRRQRGEGRRCSCWSGCAPRSGPTSLPCCARPPSWSSTP